MIEVGYILFAEESKAYYNNSYGLVDDLFAAELYLSEEEAIQSKIDNEEFFEQNFKLLKVERTIKILN